MDEIHNGVDIESDNVQQLKYRVPDVLEFSIFDHLEYEELKMIGKEIGKHDHDVLPLPELCRFREFEK